VAYARDNVTGQPCVRAEIAIRDGVADAHLERDGLPLS